MQRFIGSMQIYRVQRGFFVATTGYTPRAISLAQEHRVTIIDDILLAKAVRKTFGGDAVVQG